MKITQKNLDYYNAKKGIFDMPSFNDAYNKQMGLPSLEQWNFIHSVHIDYFGIWESGKVTMKMVKEYTKCIIKIQESL